MEPVRPLRDVLAGLADPDPDGAPADARAALAAGGHGDLPDDLIVTAIAGYAGTAPAEVAEHLAPFLDAPDAATGLDLLTTAPAGPFDDEVPLDADDDRDADDAGDGTSGLLGTADDLDDVPAADGSDATGDATDDADPADGADEIDGDAFGAPGAADLLDAPDDLDAPAGDDVPTGFGDTFAGDVAAADLFDADGFDLPTTALDEVPVDDAADDAGDLDDLDG